MDPAAAAEDQSRRSLRQTRSRTTSDRAPAATPSKPAAAKGRVKLPRKAEKGPSSGKQRTSQKSPAGKSPGKSPAGLKKPSSKSPARRKKSGSAAASAASSASPSAASAATASDKPLPLPTPQSSSRKRRRNEAATTPKPKKGPSRTSAAKKRKKKTASADTAEMDDDQMAGPPADALAAAAAVAAAASAAADDVADAQDPAAALQGLLARLTGASNMLVNELGGGSRYKQLLADLKADEDDFRQEAALRKVTEMLLMGNEETLGGFRPDQFVPALHALLDASYRPQVALQACDALCNMLEAIPTSSAMVATCAESLCAKLLSIEYIDLAERALTTISKLAVDQGEALLKAGGLGSVLMFLDFFPMSVQRSAVQTAAHICDHASPATFDLVQDSIPQLSNLLQYQDRQLIESACLCFSKLNQHCTGSEAHVRKLAANGLLPNLLSLIAATPMVIGKSSISMVVKVLSSVLSQCPDLATALHEGSVATTIKSLITGTAKPAASVNSSRAQAAAGSRLNLGSEQLGDIMVFICELLPRLPSSIKFVNMPKPKSSNHRWEWKEGDTWHTYSAEDSKTLERAHEAGENLVNLRVRGQHYVVSIGDMVQINRTTRTKRTIRRAVAGAATKADGATKASDVAEDPRMVYFTEKPEVLQAFCEPLICILFDLYLSTANPELQRNVMTAVVKMLFHASADMLRDCLRSFAISTYLSTMLRETDAHLTVGALQMAEILISKLPEIFSIYFRRQGVLYQICQLATKELGPVKAAPAKTKGKAKKKAADADAAMPSADAVDAAASAAEPESDPDFQHAAEAFVIATANDILKVHFDPELATKGPQDDPHAAMDLLRQLTGLAAKIEPKNANGADVELAAIEEIATMIANEELSVSAFEVWNSGLISALLSYLAAPAPAEIGNATARVDRLKTFCKFFYSFDGEGIVTNESLVGLIGILQGAVNVTERFQLKDTGISDTAFSNSMKAPIKLKLDRAENSKLKKMSGQMVMIEPFASIQAIEEFLWRRVRTKHVSKEPTASRSRKSSEASSDAASVAAPAKRTRSGPAAAAAAAPADMEMEADAEIEAALAAEAAEDAAALAAEADAALAAEDDEDDIDEDDLNEDDLDDEEAAEEDEEDEEDEEEDQGSRQRSRSNVVDIASPANEEAADGSTFDLEDEPLLGEANRRQRIQILLNDQPLPSNITIYQAIQQHGTPGSSRLFDGLAGSSGIPLEIVLRLSGRIYTVKYRECPADAEEHSAYTAGASTAADDAMQLADEEGMTSIERHVAIPSNPFVSADDPIFGPLFLLRALFALNSRRHLLLPDQKDATVEVVHPSEFVNNNLASKVIRQVSDLETICAASFPSWCRQLITSCPFIVSFECKQLYFYYTAFGSVRALVRYQQVNNIPEDDASDRALPGRLSRVKVRVSRTNLLKSACRVMRSYATSKSMVEVMFKDEAGTGLGPTLEFYALVSKAWQKLNLGMWRADAYDETTATESPEYVFTLSGLFPSPVPTASQAANTSQLFLFKSLGRFVARALLDGRLVDLPFSPLFLSWLLEPEPHFDLNDLKHLDASLWSQLTKLEAVALECDKIKADGALSEDAKTAKIDALQLDGCEIEALCMDFTLPGYTDIALKDGGADIAVTARNLKEYIDLVVRISLVDGVKMQMEAVKKGFSEVFPIAALDLFTVPELDKILRGDAAQLWLADELIMTLKADHGYSSSSPQLRYLAEVMSDFDQGEQRDFLTFITGCPNLPVGGFKALRPPLTVVRKSVSKPDTELPSVMTCQNYLKLPPYSSVEVLRQRLVMSMTEGQGSFHLS